MNYKINAYRGNWIVRSTRYFTRNGIGIVVAAFATETDAAAWIAAQEVARLRRECDLLRAGMLNALDQRDSIEERTIERQRSRLPDELVKERDALKAENDALRAELRRAYGAFPFDVTGKEAGQ